MSELGPKVSDNQSDFQMHPTFITWILDFKHPACIQVSTGIKALNKSNFELISYEILQ